MTRTVAAYALSALAPAASWLAWISWADGKPSDAAHVAWFATAAVAVVVTGALARPRGLHLVALSVLAFLATLVTLFLWWSSEDETGLFLVGIVLATGPVAVAAPLLLLLGRAVALRGRPAADVRA